MFPGNKNKHDPQKNALEQMVVAKVIQLLPTKHNDWPVLRVEVYGAAQGFVPFQYRL